MKLPTVLFMDGPVIIFGGGNVGIRKVEYVSKFTQDVTLIDPDPLPTEPFIKVIKKTVIPEDIPDLIPNNTVLVIAAFDDQDLNEVIARYCNQNRILVNVVDVPDPSSILFPALCKDGDINIAISTSGKCPFLARKIREHTDSQLEHWNRWLQVLAPIREKLVGIDEKNRVLELIFADPKINEFIDNNDMEQAKKKAWEVYNVHC